MGGCSGERTPPDHAHRRTAAPGRAHAPPRRGSHPRGDRSAPPRALDPARRGFLLHVPLAGSGGLGRRRASRDGCADPAAAQAPQGHRPLVRDRRAAAGRPRAVPVSDPARRARRERQRPVEPSRGHRADGLAIRARGGRVCHPRLDVPGPGGRCGGAGRPAIAEQGAAPRRAHHAVHPSADAPRPAPAAARRA